MNHGVTYFPDEVENSRITLGDLDVGKLGLDGVDSIGDVGDMFNHNVMVTDEVILEN